MKKYWRQLTMGLGLLLATGCSVNSNEQIISENAANDKLGKAESWGDRDTPEKVDRDKKFEYLLEKLPLSGEAAQIPWAGSYWPAAADSTNFRWDGPSSKSPTQKYAEAFGVQGLEDIVSKLYGIDSYQDKRAKCTADADCDKSDGEICGKRFGQQQGLCIPTWFGACHSWAPASILSPEPKHEVTYNGVTFKVNDLKALLTLIHENTGSRSAGDRCTLVDTTGEIEFDFYGRPVGRKGAECRDINAGSFHLLITNLLGIKKEAFIYDRIFDAEVWNQPLRGYKILSQTEITKKEANINMFVNPMDGDYPFNSRAAKFFKVEMEVYYIGESSAELDGNLNASIDKFTQKDQYTYLLEVDAAGKIVGGEWLGVSARRHPDFIWQPMELYSLTVAEGKITFENVKMLLDKSLE